MNNTFKCRAWDKANNNYYENTDDLLISLSGEIYELDYEESEVGEPWGVDRHRFDIEYYTGEKDKNNKEYAMGDRVILTNALYELPDKTIDIVAEVKFIGGGFYFWNEDGCCEPVSGKPKSWKIIGTIHDIDSL